MKKRASLKSDPVPNLQMAAVAGWPPVRPLQEEMPGCVRCIHSTVVVVNNAPSGRRYEFAPGEVKYDVDPLDVQHLLSLAREQATCCGGGTQSAHYFERA